MGLAVRVSRTLDGVRFSALVLDGELHSLRLDGDPVSLDRLPSDLASRVELALLTAAKEAEAGGECDDDEGPDPFENVAFPFAGNH